MKTLDPSKCSRSLNNKIVLASIDQNLNVGVLLKNSFYKSYLIFHKIFVKCLTNVATLAIVFN